MRRSSIASFALLTFAVASQAFAQQTTVLRAARMIDGTGAPTVSNAAIVLTDDRIVAVGPAASVAVPAGARVLDVALYVGSYLAIWAVFGIAVYWLYRPHGTATAGAFAIASGAYELTPLKRRFREMCRDPVSSGLDLGLCCVGSSIGLMLMMVALGVMSITWMAVTAGAVLAQKLLPPRAAIDVPVAMAIAALGIAVIVAPSSVPGLVRPM